MSEPPNHPLPGACRRCGHVHAIDARTNAARTHCTVTDCMCRDFEQDETLPTDAEEREPWSSDPDSWKH